MYERQTILTRLRPAHERQGKKPISTHLQPAWLKLSELKFPWLNILFPLLALTLLAVALLWPQRQLEALLFGLLLVASWPWVWPFLTRVIPGAPHTNLAALAATQEQQQAQIDRLVLFLLHQYVQAAQFEALYKLAADEAFLLRQSEVTERLVAELRHLSALGLIDRLPGQGFRTLLAAVQAPAGQEQGVDVKAHFVLTDQGKKYVALLQSQLVAFLSDC
jgi:hypothetical protein